MIRVEFLSAAQDELNAASDSYELHRKNLGVRFSTEARRICDFLASNPNYGHPIAAGYRRVNFKGFPYYFAYTIQKQTINILAVSHTSRHPDYWKDRF